MFKNVVGAINKSWYLVQHKEYVRVLCVLTVVIRHTFSVVSFVP